MSTPTPTKSRWSRVVRRASTIINTARPSTPERGSTSSDREDDTGSLRRFGRSRSNTSLSALQTSAPSSPPPQPPILPTQPSPIAESPAREAAALQEDLNAVHAAAVAAKSPLSQEVKVDDTQQPKTAEAVSPTGYVPPPLIDSTIAGPGGYTDDLDDLPEPSKPISDPYAQVATSSGERVEEAEKKDVSPKPGAEEQGDQTAGPSMPQPEVVATQPDTVTQEPIPVVEPSPPAVATQPATATQEPIPVVESSPPAVEQPREEAIADPPGYQTVDNFGSLAKSAPIPIPQRSPQPAEPGAFFGQFRESPQDAESAPASVPASIPEPAPAPIPVFMPVPILPSQGGQVPLVATAPSTPPPQTRGGYESEQTGWGGPSRQITETPMTMPTTRDDAPPSITSENSSIHEQPLKNPFEDPVVPRIAPLPSQGNGYGYLRQSSPSPSPPPPAHTSATTVAAAAVAAAAALAVPAALIMQGNSKSANTDSQQNNTSKAQDRYPSYERQQRGYAADESESDESQPLIRKNQKTASTSYTFNQSGPIPGRNTFEQHAAATPSRLRERGWVEIHLPDSSVYYVNTAEGVVADVELRNDRLFEAVTKHMNMEQHKDSRENAPEGAELWLRDAGNAKRGFVPVRWWVNHNERSVWFDKAFDEAVKRKLLRKKKDDEDQLDLEYRYWSFVEAHPSHVVLRPGAKQEAYEAINWAMTDRLLPTESPIPAPFTQEECSTLLDLLNRFDADQNKSNLQVDVAIQTRTIARILIRVAQWRQQHFRPNKPLPKDVTGKSPQPNYRRPFPRVLLDFTISCLCLGIPYLFIDRSRDHRMDEESGLRSVAPMLAIGACSCIMASIVLSASVTFLSLSGLDSVTRIAGFVAIISAVCSMASTLLAIFTIKSDLERPPQVVGGEGLLMLSKRSVVMSLPVVFLLYSIIGFVTGVVLYTLKGASITDAGLVRRPFGEYARWTAAGALGAFAGMVTVSILLFKR